MTEEFALANVPENHRLAYYGLLFAMAEADYKIDEEEIDLILRTFDLDGMSDEAKRKIYDYSITPPNVEDCLKELADADENLRYGVMVNLIDIAWADEILDIAERDIIETAQIALRIDDDQRSAIEKFVHKTREIRDRGLDDAYAAKALSTAVGGLGAVGVPIGALYFSGSVIGLSAAGITSGLAAFGIGLGMVPGFGAAILVGIGVFLGITKLTNMHIDKKRKKLKEETEIKIRLVIDNMQQYVNHLMDQIESHMSSQQSIGDNRQAIQKLYDRCVALRILLAKHSEVIR